MLNCAIAHALKITHRAPQLPIFRVVSMGRSGCIKSWSGIVATRTAFRFAKPDFFVGEFLCFQTCRLIRFSAVKEQRIAHPANPMGDVLRWMLYIRRNPLPHGFRKFTQRLRKLNASLRAATVHTHGDHSVLRHVYDGCDMLQHGPVPTRLPITPVCAGPTSSRFQQIEFTAGCPRFRLLVPGFLGYSVPLI